MASRATRQPRPAARSKAAWDDLNLRIVECQACPRLRAHCAAVARARRRAYADERYWGRPVPNFGDPRAALLVVGLAPGAHGSNRTGRMFTGDRSGVWLYRALYRAGFSSSPVAERPGDGLRLTGCAITAVCHCAPPGNRPTPAEEARCGPWLERTVDLLPVRGFLALGGIAWKAVLALARRRGWLEGRAPRFVHGARLTLSEGRWVLASYHPSQQNTFTGRLTEEMLDAVFKEAREALE